MVWIKINKNIKQKIDVVQFFLRWCETLLISTFISSVIIYYINIDFYDRAVGVPMGLLGVDGDSSFSSLDSCSEWDGSWELGSSTGPLFGIKICLICLLESLMFNTKIIL